MDNRFNRDIFYYGSMREYKHRNALKGAQWPEYTPFMQKVEDSAYFIFMLVLILVIFLILE